MSTAKVIPLITGTAAIKRPKASAGSQEFAEGIMRAAIRVAADPQAIHTAWVTIVRPGGLVEQIDCSGVTA